MFTKHPSHESIIRNSVIVRTFPENIPLARKTQNSPNPNWSGNKKNKKGSSNLLPTLNSEKRCLLHNAVIGMETLIGVVARPMGWRHASDASKWDHVTRWAMDTGGLSLLPLSHLGLIAFCELFVTYKGSLGASVTTPCGKATQERRPRPDLNFDNEFWEVSGAWFICGPESELVGWFSRRSRQW